MKVDSYDDSGNLVTGNYEPGNYVVTATYGGVPYTKTFTVAETTAQVDYSLIVPTTVNTSNTDWSFSIQVLKTGKGYEGDVDGTGTLATAGSHPIKIQRKDKNDEGEVVYINLDSWKDIWISQDTTFRLVSTSDEALVWDEETVEVIQDNSIKYKYYLSNSGTAPSYSETNSWKDAPSGVSATN